MARTFKELMDDVARQRKLDLELQMAEGIQALKNAPNAAKERVQQVAEAMTTRVEILHTTLEAKTLLRDRLLNEISDDAFAFRLAEDPNLRLCVQQLTQQVLQPTPVEHIRTNHGNPNLDIGAGISAFWETIKEATPVELSEAIEIENILMSVEAGLDRDMEPETRKTMLYAAGMTKEHVYTLVPITDYVAYETQLKEQMKTQIQTQMGLSDAELNEERNQLLLDSLVEDAMLNNKLQIEEPRNVEPTYEDTYGMSAETIYTLFGDHDLESDPEFPHVPGSGEQVSLEDALWEQHLEDTHAMQNVQELYGYSIEEQETMLQDYETFLAEEANRQQQEEELSDFSDALAAMADFPPQEITEEDLAALEMLRQEEDDLGGVL